MRRAAPVLAALLSARMIAGNPRPVGHHGAIGDVVGYARTIGAMALLLLILLPALLVLDDYAHKLAHRMAGPRPRWQYLLFAVGYCGVAAAAINFSTDRGTGLAANILGTVGLWAAFASLITLGRAACTGRVRRVFWRHPPVGAAAVDDGPAVQR